MSWINEINFSDAEGELKAIYDRVKNPGKRIDNILTAHSLRPHTLEGHYSLYKSVLHHSANVLPRWYLEAIGVYVSYLNQCFYCVEHHFNGMKKLLQDENKSQQIMESFVKDELENCFETNFSAGLMYAKKLTLSPGEMQEEDIFALRNAGFTDGEILEINQVVAYFNYANRTVLGLGVNLEGDIPGN